MLEDNILSKDLNKVYYVEYWLVKVEDSATLPVGYTAIFGVRTFYTVGQRTIYSQEPAEEIVPLRDSFRLLEDYDISFWASRVDGSELQSEAF